MHVCGHSGDEALSARPHKNTERNSEFPTILLSGVGPESPDRSSSALSALNLSIVDVKLPNSQDGNALSSATSSSLGNSHSYSGSFSSHLREQLLETVAVLLSLASAMQVDSEFWCQQQSCVYSRKVFLPTLADAFLSRHFLQSVGQLCTRPSSLVSALFF